MDGLKIKISSDNSQYDLNCLDPKEYPSLKLEEVEKPIILDEEKVENMSKKQTPASISFVPSVAGLIIAGEVIKDIIEI